MPIEWRDPPEVDNAPSGMPEPDWAKELVANPRQWAMVESWPRKPQANHRQAWISHHNYRWQDNYTGEWEASFRQNGDMFEVFVRYVP